MKRLHAMRELSTVAILIAEVLFFAWYLWPEAGRPHPFLNAENALLILKYSSIYGIAAVGAAVVIISGGIDLAPAPSSRSPASSPAPLRGPGMVARAQPRGRTAGRPRVRAPDVAPGRDDQAAAVHRNAWRDGHHARRGVHHHRGPLLRCLEPLAPGWRPLGLPIDWLAPIVMFGMAVIFQILMTRFQWGRAVFSIGGNETAALFSGIAIGRVKASVYVIGGVLASLAGIVLVLVQGQGKADLATGYELDIIASAVVGGASLAGGRGSVMGAVLGTLIFGVLRNALPQIPGATFYDRLIVGVVVIVIVVADQLLLRRDSKS